MRARNKKPQVIWAIDPFQTDFKPDPNAVASLKQWLRDEDADLVPVFVLSKKSQGLDLMTNSDKSEFVSHVTKRVREYLVALGVSGQKKTKILTVDSRKKESLAKELSKVAAKLHSPWVVVSSRGHSGLDRAFFGSFAENLLRSSPAPVLFLPRSPSGGESDQSARRVLFPTDFSEESHLAFRKFLESMQRGRFEIVLYYANVWSNLIYGAEDPFMVELDLATAADEHVKKSAGQWIQEAEAVGYKARSVFGEFVPIADVSLAILKASRDTRAGLIVLSSTRSQLSYLLNGGISRGIFRNAEVPVLVYGPTALLAEEEVPTTDEVVEVSAFESRL